MPATSEAEKFRAYVDDFLNTTCTDYFNINFNDLSLVDLIKNGEIKEKLKEAEAALKNNDLQNAIGFSAHAEYLASDVFKNVLPKVNSNLKDAASLFGRDHYHDAHRVFQYLEEYLNTMRDFNVASFLNVKLVSYLKFKKIAPHVSRSMGGQFYSIWRASRFSEKDARFCIDHVVKYALAVEDKLKF